MTRALVLLMFLTVMNGCNTPSIGFSQIEPRSITLGANTFDVRVKEDRAEALRMDAMYGTPLAVQTQIAVQAIEEVTGCEVLPQSITGDPAMVQATIDCNIS